ncbi:MAG: amino acid adenylation domain-containing protein [Chitinophaga sp.]|uniref:non-ribosomal peptide synthetase n=1 Tax=Chitinophaga sp. TaxID=1869181 RepID=UPI001B2C3FE9|nr:non-ribosomal peptide synthetase [Chitinophaga sp.]MBO9730364.1 amino acid adenylation domain-containing protein [Chitinophaga sp.]
MLNKVIDLLHTAKKDGIHIMLNEGGLQVSVPQDKKISPELLTAIKDNKEFIISFLNDDRRKEYHDADDRPLIAFKRTNGVPVPLSFSQERLWFLDQLQGSIAYHMPFVFRIEGTLSVSLLEQSLRQIIDRHEVLRTVIEEREGQGYQRLLPSAGWQMEYLADLPVSTGDYLSAFIHRPFDLSAEYPLRVCLLKVSATTYILAGVLHHICSDGWSVPLLTAELTALYSSEPAALPALPLQYADYALWQRDYLQTAHYTSGLEYWKKQLSGLVPFRLTGDQVMGAGSRGGAVVTHQLSSTLSVALTQLSQREGSTMYMLLLTAFKVLLYRYSGIHDIAIGTSSAGRRHQELEGLIGFFINTLVLRSHLRGEQSFTELLQQVRKTTLAAYDHQDVPFEKIVEHSGVQRDRGSNPLYEILFTMQNNEGGAELALEGLTVAPLSQMVNGAQFDINFNVREGDGHLLLDVIYRSELYSEALMLRLVSHYERLLESIVANGGQRISQLSMLTTADEALQISFNNTSCNTIQFLMDKETVVDGFLRRVAMEPDAPALVYAGGTLTYAELATRSRMLANTLQSYGVSAGTPVLLCIARGADMMTGILGILMAGGAYVPLEPDAPVGRLEYIITDSDSEVIVTSSNYVSLFPYRTCICIDTLRPVSAPAMRLPQPEDAAYIIYTSGSTGKPKGVKITHSNLRNYIEHSIAEYIGSGEGSGSYVHLSYTFDAAVTALFAPLLAGRRVVMGSNSGLDVFEDPLFLSAAPYDFIKLTPAHLPLLTPVLTSRTPLLTKRLVLGGEALLPAHYEALKDYDIEIINEYGPTEATVGCSIYRFNTSDQHIGAGPGGVLIGHPIRNMQLYVLDQDSNICPVGVRGELCISGTGLSTGYHHQPGQTKQKFIPHPFGNGLLYRTGDMAQLEPDGNLAYLGRLDDQVKIRGYRIEPGEVESILGGGPGVQQAAVVVIGDAAKGFRLVGFVVKEGDYREDAVMQYLRIHLPEYMLPARLTEIALMPLTMNGKIDRAALAAQATAMPDTAIYEGARNPTEAKLVAIWEELLEVSPVSIHDDFFKLGGHSLLAIRVISAVRKALNIEIDIKEIFDYPSISQLSSQISAPEPVDQGFTIIPKAAGNIAPLSFSQERLWFIDRLQGSTQYHISQVFRLKGLLDTEALRFAFKTIVQRHEILCSVIGEKDGVGYQVLKDTHAWEIEFITPGSSTDLPGYIQTLIDQPFDLSADYLLRVTAIRIAPAEHMLVIVMHHIVSDAWSMGIMMQELARLYNSRSGKTAFELPPLSIQYADYAAWQRSYFNTDVLSGKLAYWREQLKSLQPFELQPDYGRPAIADIRGAEVNLLLSASLSAALQAFSQAEGVTLFMTLLSAFKALLYRYTGMSDIYVGCPVAGRYHQETEPLVGFFVNTLVMRSKIDGRDRFSSLLASVKQTALDAYKHQEIPFEKIVEVLGGERDLSRHPVFQILFNVQNNPVRNIPAIDGLEVSMEGQESITAKYDIVINATTSEEGLHINLTYNSRIYAASHMQRFMSHYTRLLESIIADANQHIAQLPMLTAADEQLHISFNNTAFNAPHLFPNNGTVIDLFLHRVAMHPDATALVHASGTLTYGELALRSRTLADTLRCHGVSAGIPVLLCADRGADMMTGILGILLAGGAYVPMEADAPAARREYMITDSGSEIIVTTSRYASLFTSGTCICVDTLTRPSAMEIPLPQPGDAAYIIYTSGSTGKPKGVKVTHHNLSNYIEHSISEYIESVDKNNRTGSGSYVHLSYTFDAAVTALFAPLLAGRPIVMGSYTGLTVFEDPLFLSAAPYDFIKLTPAHLPLLIPVLNSGAPLVTKCLVLGGEALQPAHYEALTHHDIVIINEYGPTEATVGCSIYRFHTNDPHVGTGPGGVLIGRPIRNMQLYVVDRDGNKCPAGVRGELCISGAGLSAGYHHQPGQTQQKFITNPFGSGLLYRTGDIAQLESDGNLSYLGRLDDQVKIRGYRIEPGEVEVVLSSSPGVQQAAVVVVGDAENGFRLSGFVVKENDYNKEAVVQYLRMQLPEYMLPARLTEIKVMPLTVNGKVDRPALAAMVTFTPDVSVYEGPRNPTEEKLVAIWETLLNVSPVGIHDNFFELGGHSLLAMRVVAAVRKELDRELVVRDIFLYTSIAKLGAILSDAHTASALTLHAYPREGRMIPLSFSQERLWFLDQLQGSTAYHMPFVFRLAGELSVSLLENALRQIIDRHEVLRTVIDNRDGQGYQQVLPSSSGWHLEYLADLPASTAEYLSAFIRRPFDLSSDYPLRVCLLKVSPREYMLAGVLHHICSDGWSIPVLTAELAAFYSSTPATLPALPLQYADYAWWQRDYLQTAHYTAGLDYWKKQLSGLVPFRLAGDERKASGNREGAALSYRLSNQLSASLTQLSQQEDSTMYMLLLSAFKVLLYRYSGIRDIAIGTSSAGRRYQELEGLIGFFINTLVLRSHLNGEQSFTELLRQVRETCLAAYDYPDIPFEKIVETLGVQRDRGSNPLYEILFTMQNNEGGAELALEGLTVSPLTHLVSGAQFDINFNVREADGYLMLDIVYRSDLYSEAMMQRFVRHYERLLESIVTGAGQQIGKLAILTELDEQLQRSFNDTFCKQGVCNNISCSNVSCSSNNGNIAALFLTDNDTVIDVFLRRVAMHPDAIALVYAGGTLTYGELALRSRALADTLLAHGVSAGMPVLLCTSRGADMLTGILGILLAGGAYVPLEPDAPAGRQEYIITDSGAEVIVTTSNYESLFPYRSCIFVDTLTPLPAAAIRLPQSSDAAYIIYTSGSTGKPKGVKITHSNLQNYIAHSIAEYIGSGASNNEYRAGSGSFVHLSYSFDAAVTALFAPLLAGRPIVMGSNMGLTVFEDPLFLSAAPYDFIKLTPAHLPLLIPVLTSAETLLTKRLVLGGEALQPAHYEALTGYDIEIVNEYGPTEATVGCSIYRFNTNDPHIGTGPGGIWIGHPIRNTQLYVLDQDGNICPVGIPGELCISGAGLSEGYHHQPEQTQNKFITNPFGSGLLYRTGDIAQLESSGNLSYLGRVDDQVKIRGYRIEPGEVEVVLGSSPGVQQAAVVVTGDTGKGFRLSGFIVKDAHYRKEVVDQYLRTQLPEYMLPAQITEIAMLPLTMNGKVDRSALAAIAADAPVSKTYEGARNELEVVLVKIWEELLDVSPVGIHDNFFELGGDSIITIQLVSRARRFGHYFEVADVFSYQDIAALSVYIANRDKEELQGEQGTLSGNSGLLPVQQWYFTNNGKNEHISHFNQSVLLRIAKSVSTDTLHRVTELLAVRHDALGFRYHQMPTGEWEQSYVGGSDAFVTADLQHVEVASLNEAITHHSQQYQESLDIAAGPIFRMVLLLTPAAEEHHRLLLIIHHLAVDGVSWRILLEDLDAMLTALQAGQAYESPTKTSSYREWHQALSTYSFSSQLPYWERISAGYQPLRGVKEEEIIMVRRADMAEQVVHFPATQTRYLLQEVHRVYQTEVNDILLYALCRSLTSWTRHSRVHIGLEGHGREALPGIDLSRTVGWFTTMYPVMLEANHDNTRDNLLSIKEQLRRIPGKGIGYGVLKYIHGAAGLSGKDPWDLVFNYLGQSDNVLQKSGWISGATENGGQPVNDGIYNNTLIAVNSIVSGGSLQMNWSYSRAHFSESEIAALATAYFTCLHELIAHCREQGNNDITYAIPSDYGLSGDVSYEALNSFLSGMEGAVARRKLLSGVYRLSPLQEGLLFHGLYDESGGAYVEQFRCEVGGLDETAFIRSWEYLLRQHSILRSSFYADVFDIPVLAVYHQCTLPLQHLDYRGKSEAEQQLLITAYLQADREAGFDFQQAPLMRFALIRLDESRHEMIWTFHHLILDGWSTPVLMEAFLQIYERVLAGAAVPVLTEDRYEDYIRYIAAQDKDASVSYWKGYLENITEGCLLPFIKDTAIRTKGIGEYKEQLLWLDKEQSEQVTAFCSRHHLTVNTLMQAVWSYILSQYTGSSRITYGVTVSGRPEDLPGVEKRVGLYINTLPFHMEIVEDQPILTWLAEVQAEMLRGSRFQYNSLSALQGFTPVKGDLFDTMITFQNYPVTEVTTSPQWQLKIDNVHIQEQSNYPLSLVIGSGAVISLQCNYNADLVATYYAQQVLQHIVHVLQQILSLPQGSIKDLSLLTAAEEAMIWRSFNQQVQTVECGDTVVEQFLRRVAIHPEAPALVHATGTLTYGELESRSRRLATTLRSHGVSAGMTVLLCTERGADMMIGILGILLAGGCYVPLEPDTPAGRREYIITDSGSAIIVTTSHYISLFSSHNCICIDTLTTLSTQEIPLPQPDDAAYIIYTSGSTGKPKGVKITHRNLSNYIAHSIAEYTGSIDRPGSGSYVHLSYTFDAAVTALFAPLLAGRRVVMGSNTGLDIFDDPLFLSEGPYDFIKLTPAHLPLFTPVLTSRTPLLTKRLVVGGEALQPAHYQALANYDIEIINEYGPTEATVGCSIYRFNTNDANIGTGPGGVLIGRPIRNMQLYVLNQAGRLCPAGVRGELCISGAGLSAGYHHQPVQTQQRFMLNPFGPGLLYRTGDMAQLEPGGNLSYLGRLDDQVKIRGYRIEPGEVEVVLGNSPGIQQAAVVVAGDAGKGYRLAGFVVPTADYAKEEVNTYLRTQLPEYMLPAQLRELAVMPLTVNGKVDRAALAAMETVMPDTTTYEGPRNPTEAKLVAIWEELLNVSPIGIHDNFFELGGDSIITIQLVSRARRQDLLLQPKNIFNYQSIAALSDFLAQQTVITATLSEQGMLGGAAGLLPIQQWYFQHNGDNEDISHFNQHLFLSIDKAIDGTMLSAVITALATQHDALRFNYKHAGQHHWEQTYEDLLPELTEIDLRNKTTAEIPALIHQYSNEYQQRVNIATGKLFQAVWIRMPAEDNNNRLLLVVHHLAVDGVSWRILLEDIELWLSKLQEQEHIRPEIKTSSYRQWYQALVNYSHSQPLLSQQAYWEKAVAQYVPLPVDKKDKSGITRAGDFQSIDVILDEEYTSALLQQVPKIYQTEVNDILLCAMATCISRWTQRTVVNIGLEGHGREHLSEDIDISRTVGWFTTMYPVTLSVSHTDIRHQLLSIKEQLRQVPMKGLGYGVLKYISKEEKLQGKDPWDILFNYLGQQDNVIAKSAWLSGADESGGRDAALSVVRGILIDVNSMVQGGRLMITWRFSEKHYAKSTITLLAQQYLRQLQELITHCLQAVEAQTSYAVPADYGLSEDVSYEELNRFLNGSTPEADNIMSF